VWNLYHDGGVGLFAMRPHHRIFVAITAAFVAGVLHACMLFFFVECVCCTNNCGFGPGSITSIIASLSWLAMGLGMNRTAPSDASGFVNNPCSC